MKDASLLVLTGWPSEGKTCLAKMLKGYSFEYLSTDDKRKEIYPGKMPLEIPYPDGWEPIWESISNYRDKSLISGKNVVIDSCAQNNYIRNKFFKISSEVKTFLNEKQINLHRYLIQLHTNEEEILMREQRRGRSLEEISKIIEVMKTDYEEPYKYRFEDVKFLKYDNNNFHDQKLILKNIKEICKCSGNSIWDYYSDVKKRDKFYLDKIYVSGNNDHRANFEVIVKSFIDAQTIMLDEGCGTADHLLLYSEGAKKVYGIDTSTELVIEAHENVKQRSEIEILWMDNNDLEFNDESFDIITNTFAPQTRQSCKELYRTLKPGGHYIRITGAGEFVEFNERMLKRPQDIIGRGAFIGKQPKEILSDEISQLEAAEFNSIHTEEFKGIKVFRDIDDSISYLRNSGHFMFCEPYKPLNESEIQKIVDHSHELEILYKTKTAIGIPYDSLLIIAEK